MAIDKNFVVKNGLEVNTNLILADASRNKVGIATTNPQHTLHVNGGIGATSLVVTGIATFPQLVLTGTVSAGSSLGSGGQYLKATGSGVAWDDFPVGRTSTTFVATTGQTTFNFAYSVGLVDVFINGVKLTPSEFTATDAVTVVLADACFGGEVVDIHAYSVKGLGVGATGITGLTVQDEGVIIGSPQAVTSLNFVGAAITASVTGAGLTVSIIDQWGVTNTGIHTLKNVGIGTTNPRFALEVGPVGYADTALWVNGNARVTGILTVGTASIILDGSTNTLTVPNLVVTNSTTGVTASGVGLTIRDGGGDLGTASIIDFGDNLSVTFASGIATVTGSAGGGGTSSQWETTAAGIHTLSNVGIGTTNPTSTLTVKGNTSLETLNVSGVSTFTNTINLNAGNLKVATDGIIKVGNSDQLEIYYNGGTGQTIKSTGDLRILTSRLLLNDAANDEQLIEANQNGSVALYYDNSKKFETLGAGVTVTGTTFTNQLSVSGVSTFNNATTVKGDFTISQTPSGDPTFKLETTPGNQTNAGGFTLGPSGFTFGLDPNNSGHTFGWNVDTGNTGYGYALKGYGGFKLKLQNQQTFGGNPTTDLVTIVDDGSTTIAGNIRVAGISTLAANGGITTTGGSLFAKQLSVSGVSTFNDNLNLQNNKVVQFGERLSISYNVISGALFQSLGTPAKIRVNGGEDALVANETGSVELYYSNSKKFETLATGATVYGTLQSQGLQVSGISTFTNGPVLVGSATSTGTATQRLQVSGGAYVSGSVGIGTTNPTEQLTVRGGDVSVGVSTAHGVILTSPNGTRYRLIVANDGTLSTTAV